VSCVNSHTVSVVALLYRTLDSPHIAHDTPLRLCWVALIQRSAVATFRDSMEHMEPEVRSLRPHPLTRFRLTVSVVWLAGLRCVGVQVHAIGSMIR
jgi:hypothetical protein